MRKCKNLTFAYNPIHDMGGFINYKVPEKFMDVHKAAPGDSGRNSSVPGGENGRFASLFYCFCAPMVKSNGITVEQII